MIQGWAGPWGATGEGRRACDGRPAPVATRPGPRPGRPPAIRGAVAERTTPVAGSRGLKPPGGGSELQCASRALGPQLILPAGAGVRAPHLTESSPAPLDTPLLSPLLPSAFTPRAGLPLTPRHCGGVWKTKEFRNRTMKGTRARQYRSVPVMMVSRTAQPASPRDRIPGRAGAGSPLEAKSPRRVSRPRAGGAGIKTGCFPRKYILRSNYPRTSSRESSTAPLGHLLYPGSRIPRGRAAAARRLLRHEGDWRTHRTDQGSRPCRASRTSSASTKQGKEEPLGTPVGNICGSDGGCRQREYGEGGRERLLLRDGARPSEVGQSEHLCQESRQGGPVPRAVAGEAEVDGSPDCSSRGERA